jgi:hypothetical protein
MWDALSDEKSGLQFSVFFFLDIAKAAFLRSESHRTHKHISLFYFWDPPNLEGPDPVFISPRNRVAQLYPLNMRFGIQTKHSINHLWE